MKMVEKAVVNASLVTIALVFLGFSILILAHHNENLGKHVTFPGRFLGISDVMRMAYKVLTFPGFKAGIERFETQNKRMEIFERNSEEVNELFHSNIQFGFLLILFFCGLFSSSQSRVVQPTHSRKSEKYQKNKRKYKNRKKIKKRRMYLKTTRRWKKR